MIQTYIPKIVVEVEAVLLTKDNLDEVAKWCAGWLAGRTRQMVGFNTYKRGDRRYNRILPAKYAIVGEYIYKKDDAFYIMEKDEFERRYRALGE